MDATLVMIGLSTLLEDEAALSLKLTACLELAAALLHLTSASFVALTCLALSIICLLYTSDAADE